MYKKLDKSDITVRPFVAHKQWTIQNISASFVDECGDPTFFTNKVVVNEGLNISGTFYETGSEYYNPSKEPVNSSGEYKRITYSVIKSMFYETSDGFTDRFGVERFCACPVSGKDEVRSLGDKVVVARINKDYWGEKISPGTFSLTDYSNIHFVSNIRDDRFTNLTVDGYQFPYTTDIFPRITNTVYTWDTGSSDFYFRGQKVSYETAQQIKSAGGIVNHYFDKWTAVSTSTGYVAENERFGFDISAWNKYVLIGTPTDEKTPNIIKRGSASIYKFDDEQNRHRLVKTFRSPFTSSLLDAFGHAVSVNDGFSAVGSPLENIRNQETGPGAVYVYDKFKGGNDHWGMINILEGENINDRFGWSVDLSDGVLVVGAPGVDGNSGAVYVYRKKQYVSNLTGQCNTASMSNWNTVYSDGDGGAASSADDSGSLLYELAPAPYFISGNFTWELETKITGGSTDHNFGYDVSISDDRLLVGTYVENGPGYSVLYTASYSNQTCPTASWVAHKTFSRTENYDTFSEAIKLGLIKQSHSIDYFGSSVSIDGDHFAVCSPIDKKFVLNTFSNETGSYGAVYFYSFDFDRECKEFNVALRYKSFGDVSYTVNNNFGKSVALKNGYAAVGILQDKNEYSASLIGSFIGLEDYNVAGTNALDEENSIGRTAIYRYNSTGITWDLLNTIKRTKEPSQPHYNFGWSVALSDMYDEKMFLAVGGPIFNDPTSGALNLMINSSSFVPPSLRGSAYVYEISDLKKDRKVGNIFYKNGIVSITSPERHYLNILVGSANRGWQMSYKGVQTIFENEYLIRIEPGDFNYSTNPSAIFNYPLYFDIDNSGFFDTRDVDLILKYLNKQKIYILTGEDNGLVFEQSTRQDNSWWNHDVLQTESEDVLQLEQYNGSAVLINESMILEIEKKLIQTQILDIDGNGIIDMRDGALLLNYFQGTLTNEVVKKYIDNDSVRREFKDVKDYLDKYTGKKDFDVKQDFINYIDSSAIDPTGSYLAPYITSIGLYNDDNELVAVGKLGNPIKNLIDYPINICVRFDT
jgi:hypothetical protein